MDRVFPEDNKTTAVGYKYCKSVYHERSTGAEMTLFCCRFDSALKENWICLIDADFICRRFPTCLWF